MASGRQPLPPLSEEIWTFYDAFEKDLGLTQDQAALALGMREDLYSRQKYKRDNVPESIKRFVKCLRMLSSVAKGKSTKVDVQAFFEKSFGPPRLVDLAVFPNGALLRPEKKKRRSPRKKA